MISKYFACFSVCILNVTGTFCHWRPPKYYLCLTRSHSITQVSPSRKRGPGEIFACVWEGSSSSGIPWEAFVHFPVVFTRFSWGSFSKKVTDTQAEWRPSGDGWCPLNLSEVEDTIFLLSLFLVFRKGWDHAACKTIVPWILWTKRKGKSDQQLWQKCTRPAEELLRLESAAGWRLWVCK